MQIRNATRNTVVCIESRVARSFLARLRGLMFRPALSPGSGLLLAPERSIHSFGMRFPIDVIYLDGANRVVHLDEAMPPNRIGPFVRGCRAVLELPPGTIRRSQTRTGDQLVFG